MADWNKPTVTSLYADVIDQIDARLDDAGSLFKAIPTNPPFGAIRFERSIGKFQEWSGSVWTDLILDVSGGGTGSGTPDGGAENLGLGTMSKQNAVSVAITGGTITGLTSFNINCGIMFTTDNVHRIGTDTVRPYAIYVRSGLVIPVGTDKYVTG